MRGAIPLSFLTTTMLDSLTDLLYNWCKSQDLEYLSADDLLHTCYHQLSIDQRSWLTNYIAIWDLSANISTEEV